MIESHGSITFKHIPKMVSIQPPEGRNTEKENEAILTIEAECFKKSTTDP